MVHMLTPFSTTIFFSCVCVFWNNGMRTPTTRFVHIEMKKGNKNEADRKSPGLNLQSVWVCIGCYGYFPLFISFFFFFIIYLTCVPCVFLSGCWCDWFFFFSSLIFFPKLKFIFFLVFFTFCTPNNQLICIFFYLLIYLFSFNHFAAAIRSVHICNI